MVGIKALGYKFGMGRSIQPIILNLSLKAKNRKTLQDPSHKPKTYVPAKSLRQQKSSLPQSFSLPWSSGGWRRTTQITENSALLSPSIQMLISFRNTSTDMSRIILFKHLVTPWFSLVSPEISCYRMRYLRFLSFSVHYTLSVKSR